MPGSRDPDVNILAARDAVGTAAAVGFRRTVAGGAGWCQHRDMAEGTPPSDGRAGTSDPGLVVPARNAAEGSATPTA